LIDRLTGLLSQKVPKCDINSGKSAHLRSGVTKKIAVAEDLVPDALWRAVCAVEKKGCDYIMDY